VTKKPTDHNRQHISEAWGNLIAETEGGLPSRTRTVGEFIREEKRSRPKVDGRTLKTTGRREQLNVRLRAATKKEIQQLAEAHQWLIGEVIEQAIAALNEKLNSQK
jgi:hypothetical protein